jgi:phosphatidylethanolamine-binding protein (PEBP) family uncharacterized protein
MPLNGNPQFDWTEGPAGTQSYALVSKHLAISESTPPTDPGYARGFMWAIWDIPATVKSLPGNISRAQFPTEIQGAQQWASFDQFGYFAPCPNFGVTPEEVEADPTLRKLDRYGFTLYAVSTPNIPLPARPDDVTNYVMTLAMWLDQNALGQVQLNAVSDALPISFMPPNVASLVYPPGVATAPAMFPEMAMPPPAADPAAADPAAATP